MTNEEAIKELKDASDCEVRYGDTEHHYNEVMKRVEAFDMAIKALEQQSSEDCISRAKLKKLICQNNDKYGYSDRFHEFTERCLQLPSVTPKFTDVEIQKMQELEQAEIEKAYELGKAETSQALDEIITKQIDISNNQVECQTLRWVLDVMSEIAESEESE